jgi:cytochrome P450
LLWKAVLDVIGTKVFGVDLDHLTSTSPVADFHTLFSRTMQQSLSSHIIHYLNSYLPLRHLIPIESNRQFLKDTDEVRSMIWGYVHERHSSIQKQGNFPMKENDDEDVGAIPDAIELMLKQGNMPHDEIVEYALNLLVLGHDTTACTLVWAVYCLAQNPVYQERLRQDVQQRTERGIAPDYGEVEGMRSLDNFLKEVLRMFCPVAYIPREATEDIEVAGVLLPKGTNVQLCPAVVNLSPSIWGSDAALFRPGRWDNLEGEAASAYAFQSFHNGPRVCIGKLLSMVEMKVFLIELLSRYRVEAIADGEALKFASPSFTLRPHEKLRVRLVDIL